MNIWLYGLIALILVGATAGKYSNPGFAFEGDRSLAATATPAFHTPAVP
ncbi:hypothetical protein [Roseibium sp.]